MRYSTILLIVTKKIPEKKLRVANMSDVTTPFSTYVSGVPAPSPTGLVYKV